MDIGYAVKAMKGWQAVTRAGWNGKNMWLALVSDYAPAIEAQDELQETVTGSLLPWIGMKTAQGDFVPWLASQTDLLATDWVVYMRDKGEDDND